MSGVILEPIELEPLDGDGEVVLGEPRPSRRWSPVLVGGVAVALLASVALVGRNGGGTAAPPPTTTATTAAPATTAPPPTDRPPRSSRPSYTDHQTFLNFVPGATDTTLYGVTNGGDIVRIDLDAARLPATPAPAGPESAAGHHLRAVGPGGGGLAGPGAGRGRRRRRCGHLPGRRCRRRDTGGGRRPAVAGALARAGWQGGRAPERDRWNRGGHDPRPPGRPHPRRRRHRRPARADRQRCLPPRRRRPAARSASAPTPWWPGRRRRSS